MPAYAPPPQAMTPAPPIPANSFMHGGVQHLGFEDAYNPMYAAEDTPHNPAMTDATHRYMMDGVMSVPGYETGEERLKLLNDLGIGLPPSTSADQGQADSGTTSTSGRAFTAYDSQTDPLAALKNMIMTQQMQENPNMSEQEAAQIAEGQAFLYAGQHQNDGSGNAVSWAQLAQAADQFKQKQALEVQKAFDERKVAQYTAAAAQETATQDWHKAQMDAASKRQGVIESAGATAYNALDAMMKYAASGQTFNVSPSLLYEAAKNDSGQTPTSQYPMPQYPSLDFGAQQ
jgi:hypothetical protein